MRSKTEFVLEEDEKGRKVPRKIGMAPVQRAGMEYEFDLYCSMDWSHVLTVSKRRCRHVDGAIAVKPGSDFMRPVIEWLAGGSAAVGSEARKPAVVNLASPAQVEEIATLAAALGRPVSGDAFQRDLVRRHGVGQPGDLRPDQADTVLRTLRAEAERKAARPAAPKVEPAIPYPTPAVPGVRPIAAPATPTPPTPPPGPPPTVNAAPTPAATPAPAPDAIPPTVPAPVSDPAARVETPARLAMLRRLADRKAELFALTMPGADADAAKAAWLKILGQRSVTTARDLTNSQVSELLAKIEFKINNVENERRAKEIAAADVKSDPTDIPF